MFGSIPVENCHARNQIVKDINDSSIKEKSPWVLLENPHKRSQQSSGMSLKTEDCSQSPQKNKTSTARTWHLNLPSRGISSIPSNSFRCFFFRTNGRHRNEAAPIISRWGLGSDPASPRRGCSPCSCAAGTCGSLGRWVSPTPGGSSTPGWGRRSPWGSWQGRAAPPAGKHGR